MAPHKTRSDGETKKEKKKKKENPVKDVDCKAVVDDIFSALAKKKKTAAPVSLPPQAKRKRRKTPIAETLEEDMGLTSKTHRFTEDGYRIYTEEQLALGLPDSGQTADCPFDCACCF